jgi:energy-coupling factor transporter ATP-binding protein EcfA2
MNPFRSPNSAHSGYSSPLNPYSFVEHEQYYAPVDETQVAFETYNNFLNSVSNMPKRHAVLFHGETGCGKTSLMNRCLKVITDTNWKLDGDQLIPYIIDIRTENMVAISAEQKVNAILDYIHDTLDEEHVSTELYETFGEQLGKDTNIVLRFLERQMKRYKRLLVILFPDISTIEDIREYLNYFYRSNWILYFESEELSIVQYCRRHHRTTSSSPVKCLEVKPLRENDGILFVESRLSLLHSNNVIFEVEALERYLKSTLDRGGSSIREFEVICEKAYSNALSTNKDMIRFGDIAEAAISILQI